MALLLRARGDAKRKPLTGVERQLGGWAWVHAEASADASPARVQRALVTSRARRPQLSPSFPGQSGDVPDERLARAQGRSPGLSVDFRGGPYATMVGSRGCRTASERRRRARRASTASRDGARKPTCRPRVTGCSRSTGPIAQSSQSTISTSA
jgi:hypothetical protein